MEYLAEIDPAKLDTHWTLTMGGDGDITNSNEDYKIDERGYSVQSWSTGDKNLRSYKFINGEVTVARIWFSELDNRLVIQTLADDAGIQLSPENLSHPRILIDDGQIYLRNLPTSDPAVSEAIWNDNGTLKISNG